MAQKQINIDPSETGIFNVLLLLGVLRVNNSVFNSSTTPLQGPPPAPPSAARSKAEPRGLRALHALATELGEGQEGFPNAAGLASMGPSTTYGT